MIFVDLKGGAQLLTPFLGYYTCRMHLVIDFHKSVKKIILYA
jgi:hypothetical protein